MNKSEARCFSKYKGNYELFYPHTNNGTTVVFYFSDHLEYGKSSYDSYVVEDDTYITYELPADTVQVVTSDSILVF